MASVSLYQIFNVEREEKTSVLLLSFQSIFIGIFYGSFDISAHALFLEVYPATMIPNAYVISGIVGIFLTYFYSRFQSRIKFSNLALVNLIFIVIISTILWYGFHFTTSNYWIFSVFVMMGPLNIIALLGFWGTAGRIFTLRQGKRLFGLIDAGQIFGIIISTYAIPFMLDLGFETKNLLLVASLSIGVAFFLQWGISGKYSLDKKVETGEEKKESTQLAMKELIKRPYERLMALFVIVSMITAFFIQYSFLSVTKGNYPDPTDLAKFLGYFTGSLTLFTFLFKTFVYSKLMKTYGLKTSLLISPVLLGILTLIAVFIGSLYGYTAAAAGFAFFFLLISLSRLFSKALKDSVEAPSFKILYQSLPENFRHDVQAKVDGTINELAALVAGLILAGFGLFSFIKLIHFSIVLVGLITAWVFIAFWLYNRYKDSLEKSISGETNQEFTMGLSLFNLNRYIDNTIEENNSPKIQKLLEFCSDLSPIRFDSYIKNLVNNPNEEIREFSISAINKTENQDALEVLKNQMKQENSESLREFAEKTIAKLEREESTDISVHSLSKSARPQDRIAAIHYAIDNFSDDYVPVLKHLVRDQHSSVKIAAIKAIPKFENIELSSYLIDYLDNPSYYHYAFDSIIQCGDLVVDELEQAYYKSETEEKVQLRILKIYETIGSQKAIQYLQNKLDSHNIDLFKQVLWSLRANDHQVDHETHYQVQQLIEKHIGITGWNLAVKSSLLDDNFSSELLLAIEEELKENYEIIYLLMVLAYKPESVSHFKDNLENGTSESISYALELLDLFLAEEIKPKLFPLFDDISLTERVRQLQLYYPIRKMEREDLLTAILNRDINSINTWTKSCALYSFRYLESYEVTDDLIAQLFNPIPILRETAGYVIYKKDPEIFSDCLNRLEFRIKNELNKHIPRVDGKSHFLLFEKALMLKKMEIFENTTGYDLTRFINHVNLLNQENANDYLENKREVADSIFIVQKGTLTVRGDETLHGTYQEGDIIHFKGIKNTPATIQFEGSTYSLFQINKTEFYFEMFDYPDILENYISQFDKIYQFNI